jgi:hypothetical protein
MNPRLISISFRLFIFLVLSLVIVSCQKDKILTSGGELAFSTDTLRMDTVFTGIGSVTRWFKIYNENKQRIKLERIKLASGNTSPFRLNVDGISTKDITNVEIAANDSLYVFVAVTIDPSSATSPFLIEDKVEILLNGVQRDVQLEAYGQDAHYITDSLLSSQTWVNDKPYVIVHSALVDSAQVLTIQKGCRIYMHQDSKLYVNGTLNVFGTKTDSVIFQGDRLDRSYFGFKDYPGEWRGIHFLGASTNSQINYAVIKNAGFTDAAIYVQPPNFFDINNPTVELKNTIIANSLGYGILAFNAHIRADNCLIHSCGAQNLAVLKGGRYLFNYCTFATYGGLGINHAQSPTMALLNYYDSTQTIYVGDQLNANFTNCIVYGPLDDEIIFGKKNEWNYNVTMDHCLIKRTTAVSNAVLNNTTLNNDPQFKDYFKWDYHPKTTSPAKGAGISVPGILDDLDGITRPSPPAIGCYEPQ